MVKTSKIWWKFKISTFWRKYFLLWLAFHHDTSPCRSVVIPGLQPFSLDSKPDRKRDLGTLLTRLNTPRHHSSITRMILKKISKSQNFVFFSPFLFDGYHIQLVGPHFLHTWAPGRQREASPDREESYLRVQWGLRRTTGAWIRH